MIKKPVTVHLSNGLEARPIAMMVQLASQFESSVYLESGSSKVNAKSIMGMMSLGLDAGDEVTVIVDGADEQEALSRIESYLQKTK